MKTGWENARVKTWFTVPRSGQNPHCSTTASVPASWNKPLRKAGQRTSGLSQTLCRQHQLNSVQSLQHLRVSLVHSWRLAEKLHDYLSDLCQGYGLIFKHFFLLRGILIITALKKIISILTQIFSITRGHHWTCLLDAHSLFSFSSAAVDQVPVCRSLLRFTATKIILLPLRHWALTTLLLLHFCGCLSVY